MSGVFVAGVATGIGKTWVSRAIAAAARVRGIRVVAIKPIETGADPVARDAEALARAAGHAPMNRFYRARAPLAPWAATLEGEPPPPAIDELARTVREAIAGAEVAIVEGAGGLCVPIDPAHDMADFARAVGLPTLLIVPDALGALSAAITAAHAARAHELALAALVLVAQPEPDASARTNAHILRERLGVRVIAFPWCDDEDAALALAAERSGSMGIALGEG